MARPSQHYVPQFILRRFGVERRRRHRATYQVCVRDLIEEKTFHASVADVAAENGYYQLRKEGRETGGTDWLEEQLAAIETLAAPAVARLANTFGWLHHTEEDRVTLSIFLTTLYTRGPRVRRSMIEIPEQIMESLREDGDELAPELRRQLEEMQAADPVPQHAGVIWETARCCYQAIADRSWWLLVPPVGSRFYCSDCPVLMENPVPTGHRGNMGLLVRGVMLYLALSPNMMLMVADGVHGIPDRRLHHLDSMQFRQLQWLAAWHTERFIFGRAPEDLIVPHGAWQHGRRPERVRSSGDSSVGSSVSPDEGGAA